MQFFAPKNNQIPCSKSSNRLTFYNYNFVASKRFYKKNVFLHIQEYGIKFSKQKILNHNEDFEVFELEAAEINRSLNKAIENVLKSVYKEFLSYFIFIIFFNIKILLGV